MLMSRIKAPVSLALLATEVATAVVAIAAATKMLHLPRFR